MNDAAREEKFLKLMNQGFDQLEICDYQRAIKTGKKLIRLRHTSGFEILALAYGDLGKKKKAIKVLEEGVHGVKVWKLWQLLGNYYSDVGKYEKALFAYDGALECPHVDLQSIKFNRAIVFNRQDMHQEALDLLVKIRGSSALSFRARSLEVFILGEMGEVKRAVKRVDATLEKLSKCDEEFIDDNYEELALVYSELGRALWNINHERDRALECAHKALELERGESNALSLIRDIERIKSPKAKYFYLLVEGDWYESLEDGDGEIHPHGFFTNYDVVADNKKEALSILRAFESERIRDSLKIVKSEVVEKRPDDPKGVYRATLFNTFPKKKKSKN